MKLRLILNIVFSIVYICLFPSCDQDITKSTETPAAPRRTLYIESVPAGASIFLNGRNMGQTTPDSLTWIENDTNKVTLRLQYYLDSVFTAAIPAQQKTDTIIDFTQNPRMRGGVYLYSSPDSADIYLNDSATGLKTPAHIANLLPGKHHLRLKHYNCRDTELYIIIRSSRTGYEDHRLEDTTYWVTYLPENSGIPETYFNTIFIDNKGIKWLGGSSTGLTRFDGLNWKNYNTENSALPGDQVFCIAQDEMNNLWIGTENGLAVFDGTGFTTYNNGNSPLVSNRITALCKGNGNVMYVGTSKGLLKYVNGELVPFISNRLDEEWITDIKIAFNGRLLASSAHGLFLDNGSEWNSYTYFNASYVSGFLILSTGRAWVATSLASPVGGGLFFVNQNLADPRFISGRIATRIAAFANEDVSSVMQTSDGEIWVASNKGVGRFFEPNSVTRYNVANMTLKSNLTRKISQDTNKQYWIVTYGGGLTKYKGL